MRKLIRRAGILWVLATLLLAATSHAEWIENGIGIAVYDGYQGDHDILADGSGGAFIVWQDSRTSGNGDVYAQRVDVFGNELWTPGGVNVSQGLAGEQRVARMVSDGAGGIIIVYEDNNAGNYDIKAQRLDGDGVILWGSPAVLCSETGDQRRVVVVEDGTGGVVAAWEDERAGNWDVYAQRVDSTGGGQWLTANGVPICVEDDSQNDLDAVGDGSGNTIITWQDFRGTESDIYAQRIDQTGMVDWTTNGVVICDATNYQYTPVIALADLGGAIITWSDYRSGSNYDVYAQHVNALGSVGWMTNGVAIAATAGDQIYPDIATDGSGGAIIAFTAYGGLNSDNIKAQRVDASGTTQWLSGGRVVCGKAGVQEAVSIVPATGGGALLAWEDARWGYGDIALYMQKIDGNGDPSWEVDGVAVVRAAHLQVLPRLAETDGDGCMVAWMDYRNGIGNWDLFCQRIDKSGDWGYMAPTNVVVEDVPFDQGGYVTVTWDASSSDTHAGGLVTHYIIYRSLVGPPSYVWQGVGSFEAIHEDVYTYTDETTADSSGAGTALHYYKVSARTADAGLYWDSYPASGYSVDNTVPEPPASLSGEQRANPEGLDITWLPNSEPDLSHYAVYRGVGGDFAPAVENRIGTPVDPRYFDGEWRWDGGYCYKVTAVDIHDNESEAAVLRSDAVTGVDTEAARFSNALHQNVPNPFNPSTRIVFEVAATADVALRIYDAQGRLVRELVNRRLGPGQYEEEWNGQTIDGQRAASGIYFCKLTAGAHVETRKMVLLK
ncbi:MAG: T9SS type A sorting domain-containing protein [Candidatus Latescibacterota bacterium]|nr:MAG: T9SS type A sorting domain-containing protein [Candidatus Latescibacterota bacterium]